MFHCHFYMRNLTQDPFLPSLINKSTMQTTSRITTSASRIIESSETAETFQSDNTQTLKPIAKSIDVFLYVYNVSIIMLFTLYGRT